MPKARFGCSRALLALLSDASPSRHPTAQGGNPYIREARELYGDLVDQQRARMETYCVGYDTEEADYFREVEPRIRFDDVLKAVAREWRMREAAI